MRVYLLQVTDLKLPPSMKVIEAADDEILGPNAPNRPGVFKGHAPKWYPLMFEVPGDGSGEILASVQLIPCTPEFGANTDVVKAQYMSLFFYRSVYCTCLLPTLAS